MIKRVIFDIDYTLLKPNYDREYLFLQKYVSSDNDYFVHHMYEILTEYENTNIRYDLDAILNHLNKYSGEVKLDERFFNDWVKFFTELDDQNTCIVHDVLSYLKNKYELVALSNWVKVASIKKLENFDLSKYFMSVYGGDDFLKPYLESYLMAIGNNRPDECIMIGDNLKTDVIGALDAGLHAIHYTNGKDLDHNYQKVKCLSELKGLL